MIEINNKVDFIFYTNGTPNTYKIKLILLELENSHGITYESKTIDITKKENYSDEFVKINPNKKVPAIVDQTGEKPIIVFESVSILIYLAQKYNTFLPDFKTNPKENSDVITWSVWQAANLGPAFGQFFHFSYFSPTVQEYSLHRFNNEAQRVLRLLDDRLSVSPYIGGNEFSIADIASAGTVPIDIKRAKDYAEENKSGQFPKATHEEASVLWWRDQRSHKAWTFMDQFQLISLVSHIGVVFPSRFISFTEYLDWSNLGIPLPPSINPPQIWSVPTDWTSNTARTILSMAQYENSLGSGDLYLLPNILFWFGLLLGVFLVPLLLAYAIISFMESLIHWKEVVTNRLIHVLVRILTFGYIGVLIAASFAMVTPLHDYRIIIPGAIIFVLYGIGLPIAIWFLLAVPEARLHNPTFKQRFGCLYVHYKPKTDHRFVVFMFIKRFIMAVIIGILSFKPMTNYPLTGTDLAVPIVQVVVIDIALIGYAVLLFIRKPYFDHYQLWLEYLLTAINIVTVSLSLTHIKSPSAAGELIACLIQALALVACIAAYVVAWLQMRSSFIKKVKKYLCCCCKSSKSSGEIDLSKK